MIDTYDYQSKLSEQFNDKELFDLVKEADNLDDEKRGFIKKCGSFRICGIKRYREP